MKFRIRASFHSDETEWDAPSDALAGELEERLRLLFDDLDDFRLRNLTVEAQ